MANKSGCTGTFGTSRYAPPTAKTRHRKKRYAGKIAISLITSFNLIASIFLAVINRQEVIKAVRNDEKVQVLLCSQKRTKT